MTLLRIVRDARESFGSLTRRNVRNGREKSHGPVHELNEQPEVVQIQTSSWANLPPELLLDVVKRLEASESSWPARKHVVACAAVCRSWRTACKSIVSSPELCRKLTFPTSLKQPGSRNGSIQCFIKRDKTNMTFRLYLYLSPALPVESGKFLLSAKRTLQPTYTEFVISMDADNISRSSSSFIGRMRSDLLRREYAVYDTQPPPACTHIPSSSGQGRSKFLSKKVFPRDSTGASYKIAHVTYSLNFPPQPRRIKCIMRSIPESTVDVGGNNVLGQTELMPRNLENSFQNLSFSKSVNCSKIGDNECNECKPFVMKSRRARRNEKLQCWWLNFRGRVTVASVKNFQLLAATQPDPVPVETSSKSRPPHLDNVKVFLQFGKISKDMFTMEYTYPLSAFQAFAICLTSFETKLFCE